MPPVKFTWHDGKKFPPDELIAKYGITNSHDVREQVKDEKTGKERTRRHRVTDPGYQDNGSLLIGEKGVLYLPGAYGDSYKLLPAKDWKEFEPPPKTLPRSPGHMKDWIQAAKNGTQACSNFEYASALTGMVLLGNLAIRAGKRIEWDAASMRAPNCSEVDEYIRPEYRKGWTL
jgi:hypothetical protein